MCRGTVPPPDVVHASRSQPPPRTPLCATQALSRAAATARRTSCESWPFVPVLGVVGGWLEDAGSPCSRLKRTRLPGSGCAHQ